MLTIIQADNRRALQRLLERPAADLEAATRRVAPIVADVRRRGDAALADWTRQLDGVRLGFATAPGKTARSGTLPLRIPTAEIAAAWRRCTPALRQALRHAARNIETMARWQRPLAWMRAVEPGVRIGQLIRPLESAGCYVPGGRHPLPSTLLMTALPARVAGVKRIVAVCPAPEDAVLAAAHVAGVSEIYRVGGAQAIAALAYGTRSIAPVDKIVGPGNIFVTAAKKLVWGECGIDFLAGPTEVMVIAGAGARPEAIAADLIAQAEHDPQAAAWLLTDSPELARAVAAGVARQLRETPNPVAARSLRSRGAAIVTASLADAAALANRIAPEHITVPPTLLPRIRSAGSIFVGDFAPEAAGDYLSGTNHVLPTAGLARLRGGLSVLDFCKIVTVQQLTRAGLRRLAPSILEMAEAEALPGHAASVRVRLVPAGHVASKLSRKAGA